MKISVCRLFCGCVCLDAHRLRMLEAVLELVVLAASMLHGLGWQRMVLGTKVVRVDN